MYSQIIKILDKAFKSNWFLDSGSLLGPVRDGCFLPQDNGIDISVIVEDYSKQEEPFVGQLRGLGYIVSIYKWKDYIYKYCFVPTKRCKCKYAIDLHMFKKTNDASGYIYCPEIALNTIGEERLNFLSKAVYSLKKGNYPYTKRKGIVGFFYHIYAFIYRDTFSYFHRPIRMDKLAKDGYVDLRVWKIPITLLTGIEKSRFYSFNIPVNPSPYLEFRYGDWKTPQNKWNTYKDDGGIDLSDYDSIDQLFKKEKVTE